jgi:hypothetical protein
MDGWMMNYFYYEGGNVSTWKAEDTPLYMQSKLIHHEQKVNARETEGVNRNK